MKFELLQQVYSPTVTRGLVSICFHTKMKEETPRVFLLVLFSLFHFLLICRYLCLLWIRI